MARRPQRRSGDARISHQAARTPWYRRARIAFPIIAVSILLIGIGLGTTIGLLLAPGEPTPQASVPLPVGPQDSAAMPEGSPLPVTAHVSESAKRIYEESLRSQPEAQRPDPNMAPPAPVVRAPIPETSPMEAPASPPQPAVSPQRVAPPERWLAFAVPAPEASNRPMIALVFDDLGIDQVRSRRTIDLPAPLTLALLPYGYNLRDMARAARAKGHEIMVHVPMAPEDLSVDPGPNALQKELGPAEILRRLDWDLSQFDGYIGINNHMGSRFTADRESMRLVINELKRRGLVFMDSVTTRETAGYHLAAELGVPYAVRDVFLDHEIEPDFIRRQLQRVEDTARQQGHAIAIGHPHDETLEVVADWLKTAEARGFDLVPVSAIIRRRLAATQ
ncbi:divergent polysaccharide deacetylase family protein [Pacificispira sp.]|uniref:divergent polysaccharide deacetylase family protein n=1 Tax=Pacificispira sp. TaxID=2888761 RepID=UPI003BAC58E1